MSDYINRAEAIREIEMAATKESALFGIKEFPSVHQGFWYSIERGERGYSAGDFKCSICGEPNHCYKLTKYCASCGALMKQE